MTWFCGSRTGSGPKDFQSWKWEKTSTSFWGQIPEMTCSFYTWSFRGLAQGQWGIDDFWCRTDPNFQTCRWKKLCIRFRGQCGVKILSRVSQNLPGSFRAHLRVHQIFVPEHGLTPKWHAKNFPNFPLLFRGHQPNSSQNPLFFDPVLKSHWPCKIFGYQNFMQGQSHLRTKCKTSGFVWQGYFTIVVMKR